MKKKTTEYPVSVLREQLRLQAVDMATRLNRSVGRLTSCDALPCTEYGEEVQKEQSLAQELFYIQHCRNALEQCIAGTSATLRYRRKDGTVAKITYRKVGPARIRVTKS